MNLEQLGWNEFFKENFQGYDANHFTVARVAVEHKQSYQLFTEYGVLAGGITGKMRHEAVRREDFPAVGDWVVIEPRESEGKAMIHAVLPRMSKFSRKSAGETTEEQIVAANVDTVFLVSALNQDFNLRRIERYLISAWESGAAPVIVLSKADLCDDAAEKVSQVESVAFGVPVHVVSAVEQTGTEELFNYLQPDRTAALLGSSGVGKSTIINFLAGEELQKVNEIRESDGRGKHTTTHREFFLLPEGGCLIDTPGMRELQLWEADDGIKGTFDDIERLALECQFNDCSHQTEPNCAVKHAIDEGTLDSERFNSYKKMQRELAYLQRKENQKAQLAEKEKWKKVTKQMRQKYKSR